MKIKLFAILIALVAATSAVRANEILAITETGENLTATLNGMPLDITGTVDHWSIALPTGFSVSPDLAFVSVILGEPEDALLVNFVTFIPAGQFGFITDTITWASDQPYPFPNPDRETSFTIPGGVIGPSGPVDVALADVASQAVPDGGSTAMLLTASVAALGTLRRFART